MVRLKPFLQLIVDKNLILAIQELKDFKVPLYLKVFFAKVVLKSNDIKSLKLKYDHFQIFLNLFSFDDKRLASKQIILYMDSLI